MSREKSGITDRLIQIKGRKSQREFAFSLNMSPSTLNEYIKGRTPSLELVARICRRFNVNANWLLTGIGPKTLLGTGKFEDETNQYQMVVCESEKPFGGDKLLKSQKSEYKIFYERIIEEKERYIKSLEKQLDELKKELIDLEKRQT